MATNRFDGVTWVHPAIYVNRTRCSVKIATLLVIVLCLSGCDSLSRNKTVEKSHFQKKMECQKYDAQITKGLSTNSTIGLQTLERIYYSPALDSCLDIIHSTHRGPDACRRGARHSKWLQCNP